MEAREMSEREKKAWAWLEGFVNEPREKEGAMKNYYVYGDAYSTNVEAESFEAAKELVNLPTPEEIEDGGWLVIRDEDTMDEREYGTPPGSA